MKWHLLRNKFYIMDNAIDATIFHDKYDKVIFSADPEKDEITTFSWKDKSEKIDFICFNMLYPFDSDHPMMKEEEEIWNEYTVQRPFFFSRINGEDIFIFSINVIKDNDMVLRCFPSIPQYKECLRVIDEYPQMSKAFRNMGYDTKNLNPIFYHVKHLSSVVELFAKFAMKIPLMNLDNINHLCKEEYTYEEVKDLGLGEFFISKQNVLIPIMESIEPGRFIYYPTNREKYAKEIEEMVWHSNY